MQFTAKRADRFLLFQMMGNELGGREMCGRARRRMRRFFAEQMEAARASPGEGRRSGIRAGEFISPSNWRNGVR